MNKKGIIGIALFIIIGLLTFTFANPNDKIDDKDNNKGKENKKQEVINKENDLITDDLVINPVQPYTEPQNNNTVILTPVITTNPVPAVTNDPEKLRLAQEAVSKVEKTLLMDDSQYAHNLVNELNDSQDKNELNDRLAVVDQKIEFLAHLSELINQAKSTLNQNDLAKYVSITIDNLSSALTNGEAVFIDGSNCTIKQIKMAISTLEDGLANLTLKPIINLLGDTTSYVEYGKTFIEPGYTAFDGKNNDIKDDVKVDLSNINYNKLGTYNVTYNVTDLNGYEALEVTRQVVIRDTSAPIITIIGESYINFERYLLLSDQYHDLGATASDNYDGSLNVNTSITYQAPYETNVINTNQVNTSRVGLYFIKYEATNSSGLVSSETRTVKVYETIKPVIYFNDSMVKELEINTPFVSHNLIAKDYIDGNFLKYTDLTSYVNIDTSRVDMSRLGTYDVYYTVTDFSGNRTTEIRQIRVVDTTKPIINFEGTINRVTNNHTIEILNPIVTDNSNENITTKISYEYGIRYYKEKVNYINRYFKDEYITTIIYEATDSSGNKTVVKLPYTNENNIIQTENSSFIEYNNIFKKISGIRNFD